MVNPAEATAIASFRIWLESKGGYFHPAATFVPGPFGLSIHAASDLPPDTKVASCPFSLAITHEVALDALRSLLAPKFPDIGGSWSERQSICAYVCLHWIEGTGASDVLRHAPYLATLPAPDRLRTSMHFTPSELAAFKGTNLYGATADRNRALRKEWSECRRTFAEADETWGAGLTWERYLTAATYLSSRAFPSSILSARPSLASPSTAKPVLLPAIDALNHARGHAVSWVVHDVTAPTSQCPSFSDLSISLVLHDQARQGQEVCNNYGPKPNAELILAYGFTLPQNPDDTIVLQIGGARCQGRKWEIGRGATGMDGLWGELLVLIREARQGDEQGEGRDFELELDAAEMLHDMAQELMCRLPKSEDLEIEADSMRPEVHTMWEDYLEGQKDLLKSVLMFASEKESGAILTARGHGVEILREEEEED